jgi:hypothetical protein
MMDKNDGLRRGEEKKMDKMMDFREGGEKKETAPK